MWVFSFKARAEREFGRLPRELQTRIAAKVRTWMNHVNPLECAEPLSGPFKTLWRFRVGDYRLIVEPDVARKKIVILRVAHRRDVYR
ncbi:MAG: type II toxin-antitoxin system RelE/ParE family toxin [bacterium]|nr:type II toxin-antitoxin system RelE/ParE family toxin [bacterium]